MNIRSIALGFMVLATTNPAQAATNTFHVEGAVSTTAYIIDGVNDPTDITLVRGFTYYFDVTVSSIHPFYIRTLAGTNLGEADGVTNNGAFNGIIVFDVPMSADDELKYQCSNHPLMTGPLTVVDPPPVQITDLNVGADVVIKSTGYDTDVLNLNVLMSTNLSTNTVWTSAPIQSNVHLNGTNTTTIALPAGDSAVFQMQQGFL